MALPRFLLGPIVDLFRHEERKVCDRHLSFAALRLFRDDRGQRKIFQNDPPNARLFKTLSVTGIYLALV
ncbi:uncharacterized protein METZ01_LOCUS262506 [marine metagenome]|uniref:Uncharacterized protein n=1 Tax=marine metagenome TaxID=408172 RepID=A0A382JE67_9ZZZZ